MPRLVLIVVIVALAEACGSSSQSSGPNSGSTTSTTTIGVAALSGAQLQQLVVVAPAPFVKIPDSDLKTGLMEVGNPQSGEIGIGFATTKQLVTAGFQRGWETAYRAPDRAVIDVNVFEFASPSGPAAITREYLQHLSRGYQRFGVSGVSGATAEAGTSPEGRATVATAFGRGRFLIVLLVGGPPAHHDYRTLLDQLAEHQVGRLG